MISGSSTTSSPVFPKNWSTRWHPVRRKRTIAAENTNFHFRTGVFLPHLRILQILIKMGVERGFSISVVHPNGSARIIDRELLRVARSIESQPVEWPKAAEFSASPEIGPPIRRRSRTPRGNDYLTGSSVIGLPRPMINCVWKRLRKRTPRGLGGGGVGMVFPTVTRRCSVSAVR
jgi:hypothetical protein